MTDLSQQPANQKGRAANKIRFVTAASLFDGHDASINIMRRILQASGVEVIHLGHNRSVDEIVNAAIQEDVQGIAISSYQGGHVEYFKYTIDLLRERGGENIKVFGGGGGVIVPDEIEDLHALRRRPHLHAGRRREDGPAGHDHRHDPHRGPQPRRGTARKPRRIVPGQRPRRWPASSPASRTATLPEALHQAAGRTGRRSTTAFRCSASPAPAAPANPRSPMN